MSQDHSKSFFQEPHRLYQEWTEIRKNIQRKRENAEIDRQDKKSTLKKHSHDVLIPEDSSDNL